MARQAFVSYARADAERVAAIERRLRQLDYNVWIDQVLKGGQAWWDEILAQIQACDVFIAIVSAASIDSRACSRERKYASALGKPIVPVAVEPPSQAVPSELTRVQVVDYSVPSEDAAFKLASALVAVPAAPALPDPLPEAPDVPLSYLAALVDMASGPDSLTRGQQMDMLNDLEPGLRAADTEERLGAWHVLQLMEDRPDLYADAQRRIDRLRASYRDRGPTAGSDPAPDPASVAPPSGVSSPPAEPPAETQAPRDSAPPSPPPGQGPWTQPAQPPVPPPAQQPVQPPAQRPAPSPPAPTPPPPPPRNGFSIGAMVLGLVSVLFFPIIFGPIAIILATVALVRRERWGVAAIAVAVLGTLIGFVLGAIAFGEF